MDSLGWDIHMFGRMSPNVHPSLWSNNDIHRHEVGESFAASEYYTNTGGKMADLAEDFLALSPIFQGVKTCNTNRSNWNNINVVSHSNQIQKEDAKRLEPADMVLAESGESLVSQLFTSTSSRMINKPNVMNPLTALMEDYGSSSAHDRLQVGNGGGCGSTKYGAGFSTVESVESLDCLLSTTTNSNTSASVEDDGISLIFSADCNNNLWNHVSSGESENSNGSKEYNNCDQAVSKASSIPCTAATNNNAVRPSLDTRPNSSKSSRKEKQQQQQVSMNNNSRSFELVHSDSATTRGGFRLITDNQPKTKKPRSEKTSNINFQNQPDDASVPSFDEPDMEAIAYMKEMIYRAAAFRPVNLGLELVDKPKRKNVKISSDPQTVAARQRRERISDRIRVLQKLVPGGSKMDTASMLDEAANYLKFLRDQVKSLETLGGGNNISSPLQDNQNFPMQNFFPFAKH